MAENRVIVVQLPKDVEPTSDDLDLLQGIFDAIVTLRFRHGEQAGDAERVLAGEGWGVRTRLAWSAEARRGNDTEQVIGATRAQALTHLLRLVRADQVMSAP
jgi:hypothetical protein